MLKKRLLIILIISVSSAAFGQVVMTFDDRINFLNKVDNILNKKTLPLDLIRVDASPFFAIESAAQVEAKAEVTQSEEIAVRLSDEVALAIIAEQFAPTGSIVMGDRGILQFANGSSMKLNDKFSAKIRGELYTVVISSVNNNGYTLSLGDATLSSTFLKNSLNESSIINRTQ